MCNLTKDGDQSRGSPSEAINVPKEGQRGKNNPPKMSSGVIFHPQGRYWRIGGEWYDFTNFQHPGGTEILYLCRDRFDDATYAFEAHHMDYAKARAIIKKYKVEDEFQKVLKEVS
jgi:hypothetical protein